MTSEHLALIREHLAALRLRQPENVAFLHEIATDLLAEVTRQQGIIASLCFDAGRVPAVDYSRPLLEAIAGPGLGAGVLGKAGGCSCETCFKERTKDMP